MKINYVQATLEDLEFLVMTRIRVLRAANKLDKREDMSEVERETTDYYQKMLVNNQHVAYLVFDENRFVGSGGVSFFRVMPTVDNPTGNKAYIMNMYTDPNYRRSGIALKMLDLLVKKSIEKGITFITLEATEMGKPLYEKYGFVPMMSEMIYKSV